MYTGDGTGEGKGNSTNNDFAACEEEEFFDCSMQEKNKEGQATPSPQYGPPDEAAFVDALAARELVELSRAEREDVFHDIHGVSNRLLIEEETDNFVLQRLSQLETALANAPLSPDSEAYRMALSLKPEYVQDRSFRLSFLRADRFDVDAAARRLLLNFRLKLELFGADLLVRDIVQDDLSEAERSYLYDEAGFVLPIRDMAGRLVLLRDMARRRWAVPSFRFFFYSAMVFARDEGIQQSGLIVVSYHVNCSIRQWQPGMSRAWGRVLASLPLRFEAIHLCSNSLLYRAMFAMFKFGASLFLRVRVKEHFGQNQEEVLLSLQRYGIPTQHFETLLTTGREIMRKYWEDIRMAEQQQSYLAPRSSLPRASAQPAEDSLSTLPYRGRLDAQIHPYQDQAMNDFSIDQDQEMNDVPPSSPKSNSQHNTNEISFAMAPKEKDVLLGRGRGFYSNSGNVELRKMVQDRAHLFDAAGYREKHALYNEVVTIVHRKGGRFLKQQKIDGISRWIEVDDEVAQNKVGHVFRRSARKLDDFEDFQP